LHLKTLAIFNPQKPKKKKKKKKEKKRKEKDNLACFPSNILIFFIIKKIKQCRNTDKLEDNSYYLTCCGVSFCGL
jgi:hypothetical protein